MSFDQGLLVELLDTFAQADLEVILIGNAAAIIHGAPLLTRDIDFMVRDHSQLQKKLKKFAQIYGVALTRPYEPTSKMIRAVGGPVEVDFLVKIGSGKDFESVRSRAMEFKIGKHTLPVASLEDIIAAKEAAGRPKDKAALPILKASLRVKRGYEQVKKNSYRKMKSKGK